VATIQSKVDNKKSKVGKTTFTSTSRLFMPWTTEPFLWKPICLCQKC